MTKFVPYVSNEAIEQDAAALLAEYEQARGVVSAPPIPIEDIVEKHLKLGMEFDDMHRRLDVPRPGLDSDILGAIFFTDRRIVIDESLDPEENPAKEGRYRFTLAHEVGHWRLHRVHFAEDAAQACLFGSSTPSVICRRSLAQERIELQANCSASCLLMPRELVLGQWRKKFGTHHPVIYECLKHAPFVRPPRSKRPRLIGEIVGNIFCEAFGLEHDWLFEHVADLFAPIFKVSRQAMRIRLETLGLLLRDLPAQRVLDDVC